MTIPTLHPHDAGLTPAVVRKRHKNRFFAHWMLIIAILTAIPGWSIYFVSVNNAVRARDQSPFVAVAAYGLLIASSVTLVLGLWYLLLAQVRRLARITGEDESPGDAPALRCFNCGWPHDGPDRFCRHCGKPLGTAIMATVP